MRKRIIKVNRAEGTMSFLLFLLLFIVSACGKKDLGRFATGKYYVAQDSMGDVVLRFEEVSQNIIKGRWYEEKSWISAPHRFVARSRWLKRSVLKSDSLVINTNVMLEGDTLALDLLMDGGWRTMRFVPWQRPPVMELHRDYLYHDSLFLIILPYS